MNQVESLAQERAPEFAESDYVRAVLNILDDFALEKQRLEEMQRAVLNILEDLDVEKRRAQAANQMKSEFLANMSHELRTPLNAIIGFAKLMVHGRVGPVSPQHQEFLGDILVSSNHLLQLINDVLDLSKVEAGKMEFRPETFDLLSLLNEVRDILRVIAASKQIQIHVDIDPSCRELTLDPAKLKQVLYNYLSNALKFSNESGQVSVVVRPEGERSFRVEVEDSGIGIKPGDLGLLFTEFRQLDSGASKKYQGTGLGLALTRRIVEAQGGRVGVSSVPGTGSIFFAVLPRSSQATPLPGASHGED
ncbi:MAG TPA: ATP-binding protein [Planctomycetota bacterium]|nr:ATP-binding protein [Planctomycetota bacterium]